MGWNMFWKTFSPLCNRPFTKNKSISHFNVNFVFPAIFRFLQIAEHKNWKQNFHMILFMSLPWKLGGKLACTWMGFLTHVIFTKAIANIWCQLMWNWRKFMSLGHRQGVKLTWLMSIFTSKKVWTFFDTNSADKIQSQNYKGGKSVLSHAK